MERSEYNDWILVDGLGCVKFIAIGYWWTGWERSGFSDWLLVDGLCNVVCIAYVYWWKG